jgi:hypothetical protein
MITVNFAIARVQDDPAMLQANKAPLPLLINASD